jgi:hypothetical protein
MQFNQVANWGSQTTCVISRTGDLLSKCWLNVKLPALNKPLSKEEFFQLKKTLIGPNYPLLSETGLPQHVSTSPPWNPIWSAEINESIHHYVKSGGQWVKVTHKDTGNYLEKGDTSYTSSDYDLTPEQKATLDSNVTTYNSPFVQEFGELDKKTFDLDMDLQREFVQGNPGHCPKARYCDEVGHALIDKVELVIGGTLIDSHPGHYLQVWNELTQTPEKKQIGHLIGRSGSEAELEEMAMEDQSLFIPLQFFFCRHLMCSLPLIALQYHQVEIKVTFKQLKDCVAFPGYEYHDANGSLRVPSTMNQTIGHNSSWYQQYEASKATTNMVTVKDIFSMKQKEYDFISCRLMCNLVYLEEEERKTFAASTHEYLVDLVQYQGAQMAAEGEAQDLTTTYHAYFNHPTTELIWTFVPKASIDNGEPFNYTALQSAYNSSGDTMRTAKLQFNGYDRFSEMPAEYFREIVPAQYHTSVPTRPVYVYSFALEPEDFRPSGSVNLSRIDNVKLITRHVSFAPKISKQPYIFGGDSTTDSGRMPDSLYTATTFSNAQPGYINARRTGQTFGVGDANRRIMQNLMRSAEGMSAVALHPDKDGKGLFLQATDGFSTDVVAGAELRVYARSKNVLRIKSGMAGLAYAN